VGCTAAPGPRVSSLGIAILRRHGHASISATLSKDVFWRETELLDGFAHPFELGCGLFLAGFGDQLFELLLLRKQIFIAFDVVEFSLSMMDDSTRRELLSSRLRVTLTRARSTFTVTGTDEKNHPRWFAEIKDRSVHNPGRVAETAGSANLFDVLKNERHAAKRHSETFGPACGDICHHEAMYKVTVNLGAPAMLNEIDLQITG